MPVLKTYKNGVWTEVFGVPEHTSDESVLTHNTDNTAHADIRDLITGLTTRLNTLANSDDTTLDQMSEIVAYIKSNKTLIEQVTTNKVNVSDIINNLTTNVSNKPLSAAQGVALKALIDAIDVPTKVSELTNDKGYLTAIPSEYITETELNAKKYLTSYTETDPTVPSWAKASTKPTYTKSEVGLGNVDNTSDANKPVSTAQATAIADAKKAGTDAQTNLTTHASNKSNPHGVTKVQVGLGNVDNVKQYSASNPPPYPVTSVNGKTGDVKLDAATVGARPSNWMPSAADVGALPASTTVPTKVSQLTNDAGYLTELSKEEIVQQVITALGTPVFGRVDANNNIILTGELADGTYTVKYEDGEGELVDIGTLDTSLPDDPNMLHRAVDADGNLYNNGLGWKTNTRLNSSGGETAYDNLEVTGFIPVTLGDVVRFKNIKITPNGGATYNQQEYLAFYDADKKLLATGIVVHLAPGGVVADGVVREAGTRYLIEFDTSKLVAWSSTSNKWTGAANMAYFRISAEEISEASIITINQPIE